MSDDPEFGFDPEQLKSDLKPLAPAAPSMLTPTEDAYLRHYNIHFVEEFPDLAHHFGMIESGEHRLAAHLWKPEGATGTALVIHGYYDHAGLYGHLIRHLIDKRLAVLAFDLPGHGLSSGAPATIETFDHYVAAFEACLQAMGEHLPKPWHLIGQSTGGAIAMEWLLANRITRATSPFADVVVLAPLVRPYLWPVNRVFYEVLRRFVTERTRTFTGNAENPEFLEFLRNRDPLQARTLPVQWVTAMLAWKERFVGHDPSDLNLLVVQGLADRTVDHRYNLRVIEQLFDARIVYIPEARHHLVNESAAIRAQMLRAVDEELGI
jgi:alpha-beta hydrolase superfamily lysophospholipase